MNESLTDQQRNLVEQLAEEFAQRKRRGEDPNIEHYVAEHPELAKDIRELFPIVAMLDRAAGDPDDSDQNQHEDEGRSLPTGIGPATRLGEYRLIRLIGRGGMGVVYQAEHIVLGSQVAIKLLPSSHGRKKLRERFQREASAAARMHHPNIVRVFDFGSHQQNESLDHTLYYVMSLVEGWGLDRLIGISEQAQSETSSRKEGVEAGTQDIPTKHDLVTLAFQNENKNRENENGSSAASSNQVKVSQSIVETAIVPDATHDSSSTGSRSDDLWKWVARIGIQVADALDYAHSMGVVHRDIKPSNLMIDAENQVYVTDFGLAKVADDFSLTGTGDLMGTLRYMPPESFSHRADHRSDIYGLGLTLYELLSDRPAFASMERGTLITAICDGRIEPLQKRIPGIPQDLQTIVHKAIDIDPVSRYQTSGDFRDDLQRFLKGQPIEARRSSWVYRSRKWINRNQTVSALIAVTIATLVAGVIISTAGWSRALSAEAEANSLAEGEKTARLLAESETRAKVEALRKEQQQRVYSQAIADFVRKDFLALTSVEGQARFGDDEDQTGLGKNTTVKTLLDRAAEKLASRDDLSPIVTADLSWMIGFNYRNLGEYDKSFDFLERSHQIYMEQLGEGNRTTLSAANEVAIAYRKNGEYIRSVELADAAFKSSSTWLGKHNRTTIFLLGTLVSSHLANGNYRQAEALFHDLSALANASDIDDETKWLVEGLHAKTLVASGQDSKALSIYRKLYEARKLRYGETDHRTIGTANDLALHLEKAGMLDQSLELFEKTIANSRSLLGEDHRLTITVGGNLAGVYDSTGSHDKALETTRYWLERSRKQLGEDHPDNFPLMNTLTNIYMDLKQHEKAEANSEQVLSLSKSILGEVHPETLIAMNNFGSVLMEIGKLDEAEKILLQTLQLKMDKFGDVHPSLVVTFANLGAANKRKGNSKTGTEYYQKAYGMALETLGDEHPQTLSMQNKMAVNYWRMKQFEKSIPIFQSLVRVNEKLNRHREAIQANANLAINFSDAGRNENAIETLVKTLAQRKKLLGKHHPDVITNLSQLSKTHELTGDLESAAEYLDEALVASRIKFGKSTEYTLLMQRRLGVLYWKLRRTDKSIPLFEGVVDGFANRFGHEHEATLLAKANLAVNFRDAGRFEEAVECFEDINSEIRQYPRLIWTINELISSYDRLNRSEDILRTVYDNQEMARATFDPKSTEYRKILLECAEGLLHVGEIYHAEPFLRELVAALEPRSTRGSSWYMIQSMLGQSVLRQVEFVMESDDRSTASPNDLARLKEAGQLLSSAFVGMDAKLERTIGKDRDQRLQRAVDALIRHAKLTGDSDALKKWQTTKTNLEK